MAEHLPRIYTEFRSAFPEVAAALDGLGAATESAGPLDATTQRFVKLGIAMGSLSEGAVRSHARRAVETGSSPDEVRHAALLAITTAGFPTAIAALGWVEDVLGGE